jgi:hypothetical protein
MVRSRGSRDNAGAHLNREAGSEVAVHVAVCGYMTSLPSANVVECVDWWLPARKRIPKAFRNNFDTMSLLACWLIGLQRNTHVFGGAPKLHPRELFCKFQEEATAWSSAGYLMLTDVIQ